MSKQDDNHWLFVEPTFCVYLGIKVPITNCKVCHTPLTTSSWRGCKKAHPEGLIGA